jgi:hypothetical protein
MIRYILEMTTVVHAILCIVYCYDHTVEKKQSLSWQWILMILAVPILGVSAFEFSRRLKKLLHQLGFDF